jgi:hypothetical protein
MQPKALISRGFNRQSFHPQSTHHLKIANQVHFNDDPRHQTQNIFDLATIAAQPNDGNMIMQLQNGYQPTKQQYPFVKINGFGQAMPVDIASQDRGNRYGMETSSHITRTRLSDRSSTDIEFFGNATCVFGNCQIKIIGQAPQYRS